MCVCSSWGQRPLFERHIEPDPDELDMVFDSSPNYAELLQQVRKDLNWMDPSDIVELEGRHNVGFGMHIRWKTMRVHSEQHWVAYKKRWPNHLTRLLSYLQRIRLIQVCIWT